jgi:hypothetical protein
MDVFQHEYRDLEGNRVTRPSGEHRFSLTPAPLAVTSPRQATSPLPWDERLHSFADGGSPAVYWYFLSEGRADGTGYFAGYDSRSKLCIGYLGTAGFRQDPLPVEERFPFGGLTSGPATSLWCSQRNRSPTEHPDNNLAGQAPRGSLSTWDVYLLGRNHMLYHADLHNRTVDVALDDPRALSVAIVMGPLDMVRGTPHWLAVRTEEEVRILDERGGLLHRYAVPEELRGQDLHFALTTTGEAIMYANSPEDDLLPTGFTGSPRLGRSARRTSVCHLPATCGNTRCWVGSSSHLPWC